MGQYYLWRSQERLFIEMDREKQLKKSANRNPDLCKTGRHNQCKL